MLQRLLYVAPPDLVQACYLLMTVCLSLRHSTVSDTGAVALGDALKSNAALTSLTYVWPFVICMHV